MTIADYKAPKHQKANFQCHNNSLRFLTCHSLIRHSLCPMRAERGIRKLQNMATNNSIPRSLIIPINSGNKIFLVDLPKREGAICENAI